MELESNLMNAYLTAYTMGCEKLAKLDPEEVSLNTNTIYLKESNCISVKYLNKEYIVDCSNGEVSVKDSSEEVTTTVKVLIIHYLINSRIRPLTGNMISFKEITCGAIYYDTFYKRAISPLIKTFSGRLDAFHKAAEVLGGIAEKYGNASRTIKIFPLVPITYVLWEGDDEMPATGTILFDKSITNFLPGEDIVLAASFGVYALMAQARGYGQ
jgi:hypothetical protein